MFLFLCMTGDNAMAYDIKVDGIYYNYINDGKELEVTYGYYSDYSGYSGYEVTSLSIPETVTYSGRTRPVTAIGDNAFRDCEKLEKIFIPRSIKSIGERAFYDAIYLQHIYIVDLSAWCKIKFGDHGLVDWKLYLDYSEIKELVIPDDVTIIADYAFQQCNSFSSVTIHDKIKDIGYHTFSCCRNLTTAVLGNGLQNIGVGAFEDCKRITSIVIPKSVKIIDKDAFRYCERLISIEIPDSVTAIGDGSFQYCKQLTSMKISNSVKCIGSKSFYGCGKLSSVTIGDGLLSIGGDAFYGCTALKSVHITDLSAWCKIEFKQGEYFEIYSNPLSYACHLYLNNREVKDLIIPDDIIEIKDVAFRKCESLSSITINNEVTCIGRQAFSGCRNITSLTIGSGVENIGCEAFNFSNNNELVTITSKIVEPKDIEMSVFSTDLYNNAILYIPVGTLNKYKSAIGWSQFIWLEEKEGLSDVGEVVKGKVDMSAYYTLDGKLVKKQQQGLNIVRMSDGTVRKVMR